MHVLVPFWGMAGGVIKILDYADHLAQSGIETTMWTPPLPIRDELVYSLPVVSRLVEHRSIDVRDLHNLSFDEDKPWVMFTEPTHRKNIDDATMEPLGRRLIHLIQGTRHADPRWQNGYNYRLLHRPMSRVAVSHQVAAAIRPLADRTFDLRTIVEGHDCDYFTARPTAASAPASRPLRVLYNTWKSDLGDRVAAAMAGDSRVRFIAVRTPLGWSSLRNRYHGADVMLCTPGPAEGFYLPGLEAMAARAVVVTALVGGNEAYVDPGQNALVATFDDVESHVVALTRLIDDGQLRERLLESGSATCANHTLERERTDLLDILRSLVVDDDDDDESNPTAPQNYAGSKA
ncbi:MAG: hypothetical protein ACI81L_003453 [Verrucomicrobiales bacterium]|jgi:hypothetical protein